MVNNAKNNLPLNEFLRLLASVSDRLEVETLLMIGLQFDGFEIEADEFIKFAEMDLQQETTQGLVNALSNAKRAIDCQVDTVLGCFGLLSRRNFPQKINILSQLGIVTPRIVNKVVKARNYLEHEFLMPEREQAEDAVDIATLFVITLDKGLRNFWSEFSFNVLANKPDDKGNLYIDKWLGVQYDSEKMQYKLSGTFFEESPNTESPKVPITTSAIISPKEKGFTELASLSFALDKSISEDELKNQAIQLIQLLST